MKRFAAFFLFLLLSASALAVTPIIVCDECPAAPSGINSGGGLDNPKGKFDELYDEWLASGSDLSFQEWIDSIIGTNSGGDYDRQR